MFIYLFITYIPYIIKGKPHLNMGIVNITMDATTQFTYNMNTNMVQDNDLCIIICYALASICHTRSIGRSIYTHISQFRLSCMGVKLGR